MAKTHCHVTQSDVVFGDGERSALRTSMIAVGEKSVVTGITVLPTEGEQR
jgi:hypothetical protein